MAKFGQFLDVNFTTMLRYRLTTSCQLENRFVITCHLHHEQGIFNNYSPKWRWLVVDIYRAAKRRGKYSTLATDTEVNSCFSIY